MKTLARLVIRDSNDKNDGLILGVKFKAGKDILKPGEVWEIREELDELVLVKIGKTAIGKTAKDTKIYSCSWSNTVSQVISCAGKYLTLTDKEYNSLNIAKRND